MPMLERPDGDLPYEVTGSGPPLALVSGLSGAGAFWSNLVPALAEHFTVVTHDHMGTGRSRSRRTHHTVEALAVDVDALMTHLGFPVYRLLGHSTGAAVGQILGAETPERMARLVLFGGWAGPDPHFAHCFRVRKRALLELGVDAYAEAGPLFLYPPRWNAENPEKVAAIVADGTANAPPPAVTAARIDMIVAFDRRDRLKAIGVPTLVVCAADDMLTPPHLSEEIARGIPGAKLRILPYGGHACSQTAGSDFLGIVLPFLRSAENSPST